MQEKSLGRPRSEATRLQILNSTIKLLHENSIQAISIEAIAKEAGVSKATIYRWWDSKALLVIDAFIENHADRALMLRPEFDDSGLVADVWKVFRMTGRKTVVLAFLDMQQFIEGIAI